MLLGSLYSAVFGFKRFFSSWKIIIITIIIIIIIIIIILLYQFNSLKFKEYLATQFLMALLLIHTEVFIVMAAKGSDRGRRQFEQGSKIYEGWCPPILCFKFYYVEPSISISHHQNCNWTIEHPAPHTRFPITAWQGSPGIKQGGGGGWGVRVGDHLVQRVQYSVQRGWDYSKYTVHLITFCKWK